MTPVLVVLALIALVVWGLVRTYRKRQRTLTAVARRVGGEVGGSYWKGLSLEFEAEGIPARLTYSEGSEGEEKSPGLTRIQFQWAAPGWLRLRPEGAMGKLKKFFGSEDLQLGHRRFDEGFIVQGRPTTWVREALTQKARKKVLALRGLGPPVTSMEQRTVTVDVTPAGVLIEGSRNHVRRGKDLLRFVELSCELLRELQGEDPGVAVSVAAVRSSGTCPVCGDGGGKTSCGSCDTTYHDECWSYLGGCAILGCGQQYSRSG